MKAVPKLCQGYLVQKFPYKENGMGVERANLKMSCSDFWDPPSWAKADGWLLVINVMLKKKGCLTIESQTKEKKMVQSKKDEAAELIVTHLSKES
jgi:hypothetical protein